MHNTVSGKLNKEPTTSQPGLVLDYSIRVVASKNPLLHMLILVSGCKAGN